ncbi:MAG TPA: IS4 family transposase [Candidatus Jacksonbacteria bacterium]|nr:IS4 family transposase [Candidatus Jacksonbacteria bacterium]
MHQGKYVFSQIMDAVVRYQFNQCVQRYHGEYWVKKFSCWEQFLALAFGQLSFRESLRDIVVCLFAHRDKLYHFGFRSVVARNTLSHANEKRDWRIFRDYALVLIAQAKLLYSHDRLFTLDIDEAVYVIDSTIIDLCLALFPWARSQTGCSAIKLHLGLELHGNIPSFFAFTSGKAADVCFLDQVVYETGAYYVFDRGYLDFDRFYQIHKAGSFFVTRAKKGWSFRRLCSRPVDKKVGVRCDQVVVEGPHHHTKKYFAQMRRIKYYDTETKRYYIFVTNNFGLPAKTIADLYKQRWQIELFFKWLKQHLAIKTFWGRSANAVKTQICVALSAYLLVAILKKQLRIERNSYEILQILSVSLFVKTAITRLISERQLHIVDSTVQKQAQLWVN